MSNTTTRIIRRKNGFVDVTVSKNCCEKWIDLRELRVEIKSISGLKDDEVKSG